MIMLNWAEPPEAYSSHLVGLFVILQCAFLCDRNKLSNESCNATTTKYSTTAKLAGFLLFRLYCLV